MFIFTFRRKKTRAAVLAAAAFAIFAVLIMHGGQSDASVFSGAPEAMGVSNNEQRVFYLESMGFLVNPDPVETEEVTIPDEFGDVYTRYNELQREAGFDLKPYRGEVCVRYTYQIHNFDEAEYTVYANLLTFEDRIIGGDICSRELDGFMIPLKSPA
ncbi:MAG: DUF4830 domain-containing protein [Clostridia bacterium]|nr:DUF4830 domain-containing protein [Clostridia bacterium]